MNIYNDMMIKKDKAHIKELERSHADLKERLEKHEVKEIS